MAKYFAGNCLDDLLYKLYPYLLKHGLDTKASRGSCRECINAVLDLKNPLARLSGTSDRGKVLFSCLGETLWYFSGSSSLKHIEYYIPKYGNFIKADKAQEYVLGAYGPRLFGALAPKEKQLDLFKNKQPECQVQSIINMLQDKSSTRRAVIQIFDKADIAKNKNDIPCTCIMQFFIRNGKLDMIVYMRSNDAYRGLPHDIFAFTFLQEYVACSVGANLGTYSHHVGSLHLYEKDIERVKNFCKEPRGDVMPMPFMPAECPRGKMRRLLGIERAIREKRKLPILSGKLPAYWEDIARLLSLHYYIKTKKEEIFIEEERKMHSAVYRPFLKRHEKKLCRLIHKEKQINLL